MFAEGEGGELGDHMVVGGCVGALAGFESCTQIDQAGRVGFGGQGDGGGFVLALPETIGDQFADMSGRTGRLRCNCADIAF